LALVVEVVVCDLGHILRSTTTGTTGWLVRIAALGLGLWVIAVASCDDGLMTKGSYCSQLVGPLCDREIACGFGTASDRSGCISAAQQECCGADNSCGERAPNAQAQATLQQIIVDCSAALMTFDCAQLQQGNAPLACGGSAPSPPESPAPAPPALSSRAAVGSVAQVAGLYATAAIRQ
jgi:hypothetical protein